ncbi:MULTISPECIES: PaaI family thioesterase [Halocynthiibacter]|uniref:PaaI family thioesterase n=1 Tax=Halocynthiibacter halioticoli TaxID=2986804 RepID=A0AAE3IY63_9RHOB|nr:MULTISPECIES: PaaI family thioesterase [Halocynthiibacter]MCV6824422.1 PaaI family thioesterase [Halocynthiibacter halioticoli]MCW4057423.1 PaaI family thioesterase [Halocynthiibacter sp. SDUM655004]
MKLKMDRAELNDFLQEAFPQVAADFEVEEVSAETLRVRMKITERNLRPGGTVSGPAMFSLADVAIYLAVLARIGPVALAVTTNANIDFMRKPVAGEDLLAEARILKLGKSLAVGDVLIQSEGMEAPVARASLTYAIPPKREDNR